MKFEIKKSPDGKSWKMDCSLELGEQPPSAGEVSLMLLDVARGVLGQTIDATKLLMPGRS